MDRGAWWATVHGVPKSPTQLSNLTFTFFHKTYCKSLQNTWEYYNILYLFYYKPFQWFLGMYKLDWNSNSKTFFLYHHPLRKLHQTVWFSQYFHRCHTPKLSHQATHSLSPVLSSDKTLAIFFEEHHFHEKPCSPERLQYLSITRLMTCSREVPVELMNLFIPWILFTLQRA